MTTLVRRYAPMDLSEWFDRFFDGRHLPEHLGFFDKDLLRVEELMDGDTLVIRAEMPGIDPDRDVEISMHHGMLHIRAERRDSSENKDKNGYRSEFHYGLLERTLAMPAGVTVAEVKA